MKTVKLRGRFLIDTNVLIYATLERDPRFQAAQQVIRRGMEDSCEAFISVQNLAEMYPNLTGSKTKPSDSPETAVSKITAIGQLRHLEVLPITYEVIGKALELCSNYQVRLQDYFDMQLVATMILNRIPTLVTENDVDFAFLKEIALVNPF